MRKPAQIHADTFANGQYLTVNTRNYILKMEIKWHLKLGCHAQWSGHVETGDSGNEEDCGAAARHSATTGTSVTQRLLELSPL